MSFFVKVIESSFYPRSKRMLVYANGSRLDSLTQVHQGFRVVYRKQGILNDQLLSSRWWSGLIPRPPPPSVTAILTGKVCVRCVRDV